MTLDQINECLTASKQIHHPNYTHSQVLAYAIATLVRNEMLAIARANTILSNDANELYQDLQAYDRFERGFNYWGYIMSINDKASGQESEFESPLLTRIYNYGRGVGNPPSFESNKFNTPWKLKQHTSGTTKSTKLGSLRKP